MSAIKIAWQQNQKSRRRKSSESTSAEVSPDSKCPICLDRFNNISYLDLCLHKFCFCCIHEWSKNKAECPLCKQPFKSIYHSIRSEQDFKKYDLQPVNNGSFGSFGGVRFRYRTTLTGVSRQMRSRTPPMFEASTIPPQQSQERYVRRMMMRLEAKRRAAREGRAANAVREQEMVNFRRELYRQGVRVRMVRDGGRSRDTSAEFYRRNPACLHRLIPWLRRELTVLYGSHGSLVNIVQHVIMSCITRFDMEDGAILEELRPFIQGRTEHFLHEFISFAKSPFNVEAYDQHAVYDCPAPSSNEDGSSNSSVIAISEDEELAMNLEPPGEAMSALSDSVWDDETPGPSYSTRTEQSRAARLSVLDSDSDNSFEEETQEFDASPLPMHPHNETNTTQGEVSKEEDSSSDNDDCIIVGFVKPTVDRTPELVHLSSDSEESDSEDSKEVPHLPQHTRFTSLSPPALQSCDPSGDGRTDKVEMDYGHELDSKDRCSSTSSRSKTHRKSDRKDRNGGSDRNERSRERHCSKDREQRRRRRSSSREHRHNSRRLLITESSSNMLSRGRDHQFDSCSKRRGNYQSNHYDRHYRHERNGSETCYTERRSYYCSSRTYTDRQTYCRSRSRSRDSLRRDRRHSTSFSSSRSPSAKSKSHHDKPGGKRKYKTRHLEEPSKSTLSSSYREEDASTPLTKHKKKSKEKHRKKSKERSRKTSRSLSVELVTEEYTHERSKRHHKKKKKHKKKSKKREKSDERTEKRSPNIITIDSDSDSFANNSGTQAHSTSQDNAIDSITNDSVDPPALTCL